MMKLFLRAVGGALCVVILGVVGGWFYLQHYLGSPVIVSEPETVFVVERGDSFSAVASRLAKEKLIAMPLLFRAYARAVGKDTGLRAGEYAIPEGMTTKALIDHLSSGKVVQYAVTLVEGRTLAQNLAAMHDSRLVMRLDSGSDPELLKTLQIKAPSAEGLFFADTYFYEAHTSELSILKRAHKRLLEVLDEEWKKRQSGLPYKTPYEALVMASILERETAVPEERGIIAGVFVRRLRKGMRLQSDPTIIYGLGDKYHGDITRRHLQTRTAYNTYRINGLPPTPIALVGREAIHAALNPVPGKALYFVARGDGSHLFSETLAQHNRAVRQYQYKRRADYRSTPLPGVADQENQD